MRTSGAFVVLHGTQGRGDARAYPGNADEQRGFVSIQFAVFG